MKRGDGGGLHTNLGAASGKNNPTYFLTFFILNAIQQMQPFSMVLLA